MTFCLLNLIWALTFRKGESRMSFSKIRKGTIIFISKNRITWNLVFLSFLFLFFSQVFFIPIIYLDLSQTLNSLHNQFCVGECFQKSFCIAKWYYIYSGFLSKHFNLFSLDNLLISSWFWVLDIKMSSEFSTKPSTVKKITIPDAKFEIEIFDGTNNFDIW